MGENFLARYSSPKHRLAENSEAGEPLLAAAIFGHSLEHLARLKTSLFRGRDQQHLRLVTISLDAVAAAVQVRQCYFRGNIALAYACPEKIDCSRQIPAPVNTTQHLTRRVKLLLAAARLYAYGKPVRIFTTRG